MSIGLDPSRVVEVDILTAPPSVQGRNFGHLLLVGDSPVIDMATRIQDFTNIGDVASAFGTAAPEYLAASIFFSQSPQPVFCKIGRWASTASKAVLHGGLLSSAAQSIGKFNGITSGGFTVTVNGAVQNILALDLSAQTNLNGVASIVTAALSGAVCTWDATNNRFDINTTATGAGVASSGTATFTGIPADANSITIGTTTIAFKTTVVTPTTQVLIMDSAIAQAAALQAFLVANPITGITSTVAGAVVTISTTTVGTGGNTTVLTRTCPNMTVSGSGTLTGGVNAAAITFATAPATGVDLSALMGFTAAKALTPVTGVSAETLLSAVATMADMSVDWYSLKVCSSAATDDMKMSVAAFIESASPSRIFFVTSQDSRALSGTDTANIVYRLKAANYRRSISQYSSSNAYAAVSLAGRTSTVDYSGVNTTLTIKFKQEPGIVAELLTTSQANYLEAINGNVFVSYSNGVAIVEQGVTANSVWIDEVIGYDWLQNQLQIGRFNVLTGSVKIPQTDDGMNILFASDIQVLETARRNGFIAPGQWNAAGFGELKNGDFLDKGYYIYSPPMRFQSQADRSARKAPITQIAVKLAGAIHSCVIQVLGNR